MSILHRNHNVNADKSLVWPGRKQLQRQKILIFIYPIYNHNWWNISTIYIYIYITRPASNEIFSPSNKRHREVGQAKDSSAPLCMLWEEKKEMKKRDAFTNFGKETKFFMKLSKNTDWRVAYEPNNTTEKIVVCKNSKTVDKYGEIGIYQPCCPDCRKIICWTSCIFPKKDLVNILRVID